MFPSEHAAASFNPKSCGAKAMELSDAFAVCSQIFACRGRNHEKMHMSDQNALKDSTHALPCHEYPLVLLLLPPYNDLTIIRARRKDRTELWVCPSHLPNRSFVPEIASVMHARQRLARIEVFTRAARTVVWRQAHYP